MPTANVNLMFRAFSDETRLRILNLLQQGELCVGDIVTILGLPQPTVSRHLLYLKRALLVQTRNNGLWMFYSLAKPKGAFHKKLLECLKSCFEDVPAMNKDERKARKIKKSGGCC
ncbi:metalloregulator ArsR/SmtB family transcription factor [bacterium]|nr:metalloregulator ArsR/SmtB family transcription factor [bacterium]